MDRFLRRATLAVLLLLAVLVWFETKLFGGERGALRLVVGVLCIYVAVQSLERQRLADAFKELLTGLQRLRAEAAAGGAAGPTAKERREAAEILIAALRRGGPTADLALGNLRRITGQDFGRDADAWQRWVDEQPR
ncbi:MAG TPA: hypothetical protein VK081_14805 [Planctomycetota bacterium]|nr:hypothetical protein [Planctomycetota bacterium]